MQETLPLSEALRLFDLEGPAAYLAAPCCRAQSGCFSGLSAKMGFNMSMADSRRWPATADTGVVGGTAGCWLSSRGSCKGLCASVCRLFMLTAARAPIRGWNWWDSIILHSTSCNQQGIQYLCCTCNKRHGLGTSFTVSCPMPEDTA